ncbi:hypothetical protein DM01DRAFT_1161393 [Hesseltinella vesiculosa]|uniref:Uncharacterized protein n=1 Tax=Hesseltinella vesiculosa TaxID=101127 RepID=A0A1X2GU19_9FUNG|nr:hypothetical protein DM01DRAFT_1161393 [Hesseltinella vesiculosa]
MRESSVLSRCCHPHGGIETRGCCGCLAPLPSHSVYRVSFWQHAANMISVLSACGYGDFYFGNVFIRYCSLNVTVTLFFFFMTCLFDACPAAITLRNIFEQIHGTHWPLPWWKKNRLAYPHESLQIYATKQN